MKFYTADFETTTDESDCRVWAWAICEIGAPEHIIYGTDIESFLKEVKTLSPSKMYFHNLAFDGAFIMDYLLNHAWEHTLEAGAREPMTFNTLISDMNQIYNIRLNFTKRIHCDIRDSLKVIPLSIASMAKAFNLPIMKGELDYETMREVGHQLTDEEKAYIKNDVVIAAMALDIMFSEGLDKMTAGANALADYKMITGGKDGFRRVFPLLDHQQDAYIRKAYRGGFTYADPRFRGKVLNEGVVFDVNSLYPSVMAACDGQALPWGEPVWFDGEYTPDENMPLWVATVTCMFRVKQDHIPCIQLKGNWNFRSTEYITDSGGEQTFTVTNIDWALICQQYDVEGVEWVGGYKLRASTELCKPYVDKWVQVKNKATVEGNAGLRQIAKLMLNSVYGKFATRTMVQGRHPEIVNGVLRYVDNPEPDEKEGVYLPVGVFITAYARYKTVTSAQMVYERFVYADTDSLHLLGTEIPSCIDVDPVRLGAWKHESTFSRAKFLGAKCYVEEIGESLEVHVSGMPKQCHSQVTLENFEVGAEYQGKLYTHRVIGGIVLVPGPMKIRERG